MQLAARHAFGDFRALEFGDRAQHRHGELVLRLVDVLLAVDDDLFLVEQHLADDDRLVDHGARNTVCREEIDHVEDVGPQIPPQLLQGWAIHAAAGVAVVDVLFDQHVSGRSDLPSQLGDLAFDRPLLFLRICAHPRVQCRPLHIPESIPQLSERVESDSGGRTKRLRCQVRRVLTARPASHPSGGIWNFPVSPRCPERRVGVDTGKSQSEHMSAAAPPETDSSERC